MDRLGGPGCPPGSQRIAGRAKSSAGVGRARLRTHGAPRSHCLCAGRGSPLPPAPLPRFSLVLVRQQSARRVLRQCLGYAVGARVGNTWMGQTAETDLPYIYVCVNVYTQMYAHAYIGLHLGGRNQVFRLMSSWADLSVLIRLVHP